MNRPRLESCYFGESRQWERMAAVLRMTAETQCPTWDIAVRRIVPEPRTSALGLAPSVANTQKLEEWCRIVAAAANGDRLLLIDADTAILRPLDDVWEREFDLAYTTKPYARTPFNGGVLFLRISPVVRRFFVEWAAENAKMLGDAEYHHHYRLKYFGLNQAAFGKLLEDGKLDDLNLLDLPCAEWNCEDTSWKRFDATRTRILHVKDGITQETGNLRKTIFGGLNGHLVPQNVQELAYIWRQLEAHTERANRRRTA